MTQTPKHVYKLLTRTNESPIDKKGKEIGAMSDKFFGLTYKSEACDVTEDPVNAPPHYNQGAIECIDYIAQVLGPEGFKSYCLGNVIKYIHRHTYKGKPEEDLKKASYYLNKAVDSLGETSTDK